MFDEGSNVAVAEAQERAKPYARDDRLTARCVIAYELRRDGKPRCDLFNREKRFRSLIVQWLLRFCPWPCCEPCPHPFDHGCCFRLFGGHVKQAQCFLYFLLFERGCELRRFSSHIS